MKIRNGFVSNSSSSSYLLAVPSKTDLNRKNLLDALGVVPGTPAEKIVGAYADYFLAGEVQTPEELIKRYGEEYSDELPERIRDLVLKDGWTLIHIRACSDDYDDAVGQALHYGELEIDTPNLKLIKEY